MKAATGELNLTLITVLALGAVLAFFWAIWPTIKEKINVDWSNDPNDPTETGMVTESVDGNILIGEYEIIL